MKNKFKVILTVFLGIAVLAFAFVGCAQPNNEQQGQEQTEMFPERDIPGAPGENMGRTSDEQELGNRNSLDNNLQGMDRTPQANRTPQVNRTPLSNNQRNGTGLDRQAPMQQTGFDKERADKIVNQLNKMEEIGEVNAVVNDDTAIVVYAPKNPNNASNDIDNMVAEKVRSIDNTITKVEVSHSSDVRTKVNELTDNIANDEPMEELNNMFEQLMRTINPRS